MKKLFSLLSRISVRLLLFNILIVFFPIASFLFLDTYEKQLLRSLEHALVQQGRLLASALSERGELTSDAVKGILQQLRRRHEARFRVVDNAGRLLADSSSPEITGITRITESGDENYRLTDAGNITTEAGRDTQDSLLYQVASFPVRFYRKYLQPPQPPLPTGDFYSNQTYLLGIEVQAALEGKYGAVTRISSGGQVSVNLYSAIPIWKGDSVAGAVLVSQSSYRILQDIYELRLEIFKIFLLSLTAAILLSLFLSATITGPIRRLSNQARLILDRRGRLKNLFIYNRRKDEIGDLSHSLHELTRKLEDHIQFIESFASDVSHEFKNPLASIRSAAEMIKESAGCEEHDRFLSMIQKDVARMEHLLSDVREITTIDSELEAQIPARIDIKPIIDAVVEAFRIRGSSKTIRFSIKTPQEPVMVAICPERFVQVLENIIDNAQSFSPENGIIKIEVSKNISQTTITLSDKGPGIDQQNIELIFNRFFSTRRDGDGGTEGGLNHTGLGLAIVKAIVESCGGTVSACNLKGGGARFLINFPSVPLL